MTENQRIVVFQKIEELAKQKQGSISKALRSMDIGSSTWHNMKVRTNMTLEMLENIATHFEVDLAYFFIKGNDTLLPDDLPTVVEQKTDDEIVHTTSKVDDATLRLIERLETELNEAKKREEWLKQNLDELKVERNALYAK